MEAIKNFWRERYTYARYIALGGSLLNILGVLALFLGDGSDGWLTVGAVLLLLGIFLALCAYCLGGLWRAIKSALSIGGWGFLVIPFPFCLATGPIAAIFALLVFLLLPVIPVSKAREEHMVRKQLGL